MSEDIYRHLKALTLPSAWVVILQPSDEYILLASIGGTIGLVAILLVREGLKEIK